MKRVGKEESGKRKNGRKVESRRKWEEKKEREERMISRERKNFLRFSTRKNRIVSVQQCEEWIEKWR